MTHFCRFLYNMLMLKELVPSLGQLFFSSRTNKFLTLMWSSFKSKYRHCMKVPKVNFCHYHCSNGFNKETILLVHRVFLMENKTLWLHMYHDWLKKITKYICLLTKCLHSAQTGTFRTIFQQL